MRALPVILLLGAAACDDETYMIVSVDRRPAVHHAATLRITLSNEGTSRTDERPLGGKSFPVTFAVSAPGRSGELGIGIEALDANGLLVGRGAGTTTLDQPTAEVVIDSADFVVNTDYANDQFLGNDYEAGGLQLATTSSGAWMAAYRDECTMCNIFGRRFDRTGLPLESTVAAGTNGFRVSTTLTTSLAVPAIAASGLTTLVFWDFIETTGSPALRGIACRAFDQGGTASPPSQRTTVSGESTDVVTATALSNGNFVVTWQTFMTTNVIRAVIVLPDCTALSNVATVSDPNLGSARRSHAAANSDRILYAWIVDGNVRVRPGANNGTFVAAETTAIAKTSSENVDHVRVVPLGAGFAIFARWRSTTSSAPGKIAMYRANNMGIVSGSPTLITDDSQSDFASSHAIGVTTRADGAMLVAWHACPQGAGSCDVFGRVVRPTGVPVGDVFPLATSTGGDQVRPSVASLPDAFVAAWDDSSGLEPDRSGQAVRARILYPPYDNAVGILGAPCGAGLPACRPGLACGMGSDGASRCFETCIPPTCPGGGSCTSVDAATSACTF
jgi:hypothetical protein